MGEGKLVTLQYTTQENSGRAREGPTKTQQILPKGHQMKPLQVRIDMIHMNSMTKWVFLMFLIWLRFSVALSFIPFRSRLVNDS